MTTHPLSGVYAAAVTPLKPDSTPDTEVFPDFLAFLAERGCHGALILGTTGEGPSFSAEERMAIWQAAIKIRESHPEFRLLAGTGTPSLQETIELTKRAFDLGFQSVVVLPPYYFREASEDGLFTWFERLIQKAVPADGYLLAYHIPGLAGIGFSRNLLMRLKDAFPVQFAGIKDSSNDPDFASFLGQTFGKDLAVFTGIDSNLSLALQNGAAGCITALANLISPSLRAIYDGISRNEDLSETQILVTAQRRILEQYVPFPSLIKGLVADKHGFPRWPVRPPLEDIPKISVTQASRELDESV
ncbi:MAG: dihydrodipicolinate synthase family protein [Anaerolineae bacterium]|nr:dihydrodipicolinate synthase family protein [Anaerolineae bacterium]